MTDQEIRELIDRLTAEKGASLLRRTSHPPTPQCCSVPRLESGSRLDDWTQDERTHLADCPVCKRRLEILRRLDAEPAVAPTPSPRP